MAGAWEGSRTRSALGVESEAAFDTGSLRDVLAVLPDEAAVRAVTPDVTALAQITSRDGIRGVTIGACDHLTGVVLPGLTFESTAGPVDLATDGTTKTGSRSW